MNLDGKKSYPPRYIIGRPSLSPVRAVMRAAISSTRLRAEGQYDPIVSRPKGADWIYFIKNIFKKYIFVYKLIFYIK